MKPKSHLKYFSVIALFTLVGANLSAQVDTAWTRLFATDQWDEARAVTTDEENNIYVAGWNYQWSVNYDYIFCKYSAQGEFQWSKTIDYATGDQASHIVYDGLGNIYVAGFVNGSYSTTGGSICLMKYSVDGDSIWHFVDPNTFTAQVKGISFDSQGNIILAGFELGGGISSEYVTMKIDPDGNQLWHNTFNNYGPNETNNIYSMCVNQNDEIIVTGTCDDAINFYTDLVTIKYAPDGETVWLRQFNGPENYYDSAASIRCDVNGNIIVAGTVSSQNPAQTDVVLLKYSDTGELLWDQYYDYAPAPQSFDYATDLQLDENGNIYLVGSSSYSNAQATNRLLTAKFNSAGDTLWTRRWGPQGDKVPKQLLLDDGDNVYIGGYYYNDGGTGYDGIVLRYTANGSLVWEETYNDGAMGEELFNAIALDGANDLIAVGRMHSPTTFDFLTVKYANGVVGVVESQKKDVTGDMVRVYPNPCTASLSVMTAIPHSGDVIVMIMDAQGRRMMEQRFGGCSGFNRFEFDVKSLETGVYELQLIAEGHLYQARFVKSE